jgi:hypothetical protein
LHYRAYFLDRENHIRHAHDLECETDAEAEARLEAMDRQGFAAELWRGAEKLLTLPLVSVGAHIDAGSELFGGDAL